MIRAAAMAAILAVGVSVMPGCDKRYPGLHVAGNQLVDSQGHALRLLGVNRSGAEYACVNGHEPLAGPAGGRAIAAMTAWRINAVRIPLNEHCWLGINGSPEAYGKRHYRAAVKRYVARLHRAGLYVVLDLHWNAPGREQADGQQRMADIDHAPAFWSSVARTFKHDHAIAFDLYNEPHDISWRCWRDGCLLPEGWRSAGMQTLVAAVRSTGALQPIIATGIDWGTDLSSWLEYRPHDPRNQLAAGIHSFDFSHCTSKRCWTKTFAPVAQSVPVVATELGQRECSTTFMDRFMDWADAAGVSYIGWSWNPFGCRGPALIESWSGEPTGSGRQLRARLLDLEPRKLESHWNTGATR
jgi:endoglucanase